MFNERYFHCLKVKVCFLFNNPLQVPTSSICCPPHPPQECARTPGFISMMRSSAGGAEKMQYLDYENYRHITFKWHFKLTKALVVLLESKDYMQVWA